MTEFYISSTKYSIQERQTKKHGKVYDVVFRVVTPDGIEKQKRLSGYSTKALAKHAYAEFDTERCEHVKNNPLKRRDPGKEIPTVGELIRQYIASLGNQNKESSIYDKRNIYDLFILPKYESVKINALTKEELCRWQDELWTTRNPRTGEYYSYKYLTKIRTYFSAFLTWSESRYGYPNNLTSVQRPKRRAPKTQMQFWTREQFEQFISVVDDPMWHCFFTMLFYTGRRFGEVVALTPEDVHAQTIDFDKSVTRKTLDGSTYKITSTKAERVQSVEICPVMIDELRQYEPQSPFFFGGNRPLYDKKVVYAFEKYCTAAGLERIRIHDLRHSFVSMLLHYGANFMVVADLIGDTVEQVTRTYGHLYDADKHAVISKIT